MTNNMTDKEKSKQKKTLKESESNLDKVELELEAEFLDRELAEASLHNRPKFGISNEEPELALGKRLQDARESKKLTQGQLSEITKLADAEGTGISRAVLSMYEVGKNRPSPREIRLLCEALRISPNLLIYGDEDPFGDFLDRHRWGFFSQSDPEFYALLNFAFFSLHKHQKMDVMNIIMSLLRGWDKSWFEDKTNDANKQFLEMAENLKTLLEKRNDLEK